MGRRPTRFEREIQSLHRTAAELTSAELEEARALRVRFSKIELASRRPAPATLDRLATVCAYAALALLAALFGSAAVIVITALFF
jgi:hypothetical protein